MSVRRAIVEMDVSTLNVAEFCRAHGVSTWFFYDLRRRHQRDGDAVLEPRSRAPKRVANRVGDDVRDLIIELRKDLAGAGVDHGPATIRWHLARRLASVPSEATIWRVLTERGFIIAEPRKRPSAAVRRFAAERANECWQIDATKWWLTTDTMIEIINVIDDCTRVLIASVTVETCTTANSFDALCAGATRWGWPERVLSDNAAAFAGRHGRGGLIQTLATLGVSTRHARPYHPQTCGKVERFHQTLKRYLAHHGLVASLADLQNQLDSFAAIYNHHRPHRGIGRRIPAEVWTTTARSGPSSHPLGTPTTVSRNTVHDDGRLTIGKNTRIGLGTAYRQQTATTVLTGNHADVFIDGHLIRSLTIQPDRQDQPHQPTPRSVSDVPRHP